MGEYGVVDAYPEGLGDPVGQERDYDGPRPGQDEGGSQAQPSEKEGQADREDPEQAGHRVINGNGPQAPAGLLLQRQPAGGANRAQPETGLKQIP